MRERITDSPLVTTGLHVYARPIANPTQLTDYGWFYYRHSTSYEKIVDEPKTAYVAYGKGVRRKVFKNVAHDQWTGKDLSIPQWVQTGPYNEAYVSAGELLSGEVGQADLCSLAYARAVDTGKVLEYRHYDRWLKVKPSVSTRANLGVFLLELRDFKRMWDFIPNKHLLLHGVRAKGWWNVLQWWKEIKSLDPTPAGFAKYINSQHLNYNFGWKPFVSDIMKCWRGLERMEGRLAKFKRQADKELRKRSRDEPIYSANTPSLVTFTYNGAWRHCFINDRKESYASAFDFSYIIPQYSAEEMRWRALADTLGFNPGLSTLWAVLPWSFVGDWFYNVGGLLQSFESDWLAPWIKLHQGCYSRKLEGTFKWNVKGSDAYGGVTLPGITIDYSQYIRKVGLPNYSAATDPLDADKIRLGTSLLLSLFQR